MKSLLLGCCLPCLLAPTAGAGNWPQWGGRNERNFVSDEKGLPAEFRQGAGSSGHGARNIKWTHDLGAHTFGSTLVADGKVYIGAYDCSVTVLACNREKSVLAVNRLDGPIYTTPVAANGVLYIATRKTLVAIRQQTGS